MGNERPVTCTGFTTTHDLCADCGKPRWHTDHTTEQEPPQVLCLSIEADWHNWQDPTLHVEPLWAGEGVSILTGQRKQGKSLVLLHSALQSARNDTDTLVLLGEGKAGVRQRLDALGAFRRPPERRLDFQVGARYLFGDKAEQERLAEFVDTAGYGAVVIDPLQRYKSDGFDENSADYTRGPIHYLEGLGVPVLMGAHTGKDRSKGVRGSSAWEGEASAFSYPGALRLPVQARHHLARRGV